MANKRAKDKLCIWGRAAARTDFPAAALVADRLVTLPVHPPVRAKDLDALCALVNALETGPSREIPETAARPLSRIGV